MTAAEIQALADQIAPALRASWLRAVRQWEARLTPAAVGRILRARTPASLRAAIAAAMPDSALARTGEVFERGMRQVIARVPVARVRGSFTGVSAAAVRVAQRTAGARVVALGRAARRTVRQEVVRAMRGEQTVDTLGRRIRAVVGLSPSQAKALATRRATLERAGAPAAEVEATLGRTVATWVQQRAQTIARTESIAASNEGQQATWEALLESGLIAEPVKVWIVTRDDRLCPVCAPMAGQAVALDDDFETGLGAVRTPPAHPNCRCAMRLESSRRAAA